MEPTEHTEHLGHSYNLHGLTVPERLLRCSLTSLVANASTEVSSAPDANGRVFCTELMLGRRSRQ